MDSAAKGPLGLTLGMEALLPFRLQPNGWFAGV